MGRILVIGVLTLMLGTAAVVDVTARGNYESWMFGDDVLIQNSGDTLTSGEGNYRLKIIGFGFCCTSYLDYKYIGPGEDEVVWDSINDRTWWWDFIYNEGGYGYHQNQWGNTDGNESLALMQLDGNFVLYDWDYTPVWSTSTDGHSGAFLCAQDDGNLVVYSSSVTPLWSIQ